MSFRLNGIHEKSDKISGQPLQAVLVPNSFQEPESELEVEASWLVYVRFEDKPPEETLGANTAIVITKLSGWS